MAGFAKETVLFKSWDILLGMMTIAILHRLDECRRGVLRLRSIPYTLSVSTERMRSIRDKVPIQTRALAAQTCRSRRDQECAINMPFYDGWSVTETNFTAIHHRMPWDVEAVGCGSGDERSLVEADSIAGNMSVRFVARSQLNTPLEVYGLLETKLDTSIRGLAPYRQSTTVAGSAEPCLSTAQRNQHAIYCSVLPSLGASKLNHKHGGSIAIDAQQSQASQGVVTEPAVSVSWLERRAKYSQEGYRTEDAISLTASFSAPGA